MSDAQRALKVVLRQVESGLYHAHDQDEDSPARRAFEAALEEEESEEPCS